jgi:hypothetical protein
MFRHPRHTRAAAGMVALLVAAACGEPSVNQPLPPNKASTSQGPSSNAAIEAQINGLINALYAPKDQGAVHKEFAQIKSAIASGRTEQAQSSIVAFFSRLLTDSKNGVLQDPNGAQPPTTADALNSLLNSVSTFGGIATPIPPTSADAAVGVIGPAGGTLLSSSGFGGLSFPPGALPSDAIVVINRLPNPVVPKSGPLPTTLDQYPLFYDFSTIPAIAEFGQPVTVGVCQLEVGQPFAPATQAIADRLQLAHPNPANPTTVELLPRVDANFMHCDGVSLASSQIGPSATGLAARALNAFATVGSRVAALFLPTPAYAVHGGLGGLVRSFSPFAAVDPGVSIVGVCGSPMVGVATTYPTIDAAVAGVNAGGVIRVCPQTINVASTITITKPVTIEGSVPATPPQINIGPIVGFVVAPSVQGSVTFRSLSFTMTGNGSVIDLGTGQAPNFPPGTWWEVTIENSIFNLPPGLSRAVRAFHTIYAHPTLTFRFNQVTGGVFPVVTLTNSSTSDIEVLSNSFTGPTSVAAILLQNENFARVAGNIFSSCGAGSTCLRTVGVTTAIVTNNTISIPSSTSTLAGFAITGSGNTTISNNVILGGGLVGPASDTASYRFRAGGIVIGSTSTGSLFDASLVANQTANISMNTITNAASGIRAMGGGVTITGTNNTISNTHSVVRMDNATTTPSSLSVTTSDFTSFVSAIRFAWLLSAPGTINATCNWWGTAAGPQAFAVGIPSSMYVPFATAPIANGAGGLCNGSNP